MKYNKTEFFSKQWPEDDRYLTITLPNITDKHDSYPTTVKFDANYIPWVSYYNRTDGANITYGHWLVLD